MKLFGKKKKDDKYPEQKTDLEKKFEEVGRKVGEATGKVTQKSVDKYKEVVANLEESGKLDKVREVRDKVAEKTDEFFVKAEEVITDTVDKVTKKNQEKDE